MRGTDVLRPGRFDIAEDCDDLVVRQDALIDGHVGRVVGIAEQGTGPVFRQAKQGVTVMMPRMSGFIMRRGRKPSVLTGRTPIRLTFQVRSMTGGAVS